MHYNFKKFSKNFKSISWSVIPKTRWQEFPRKVHLFHHNQHFYYVSSSSNFIFTFKIYNSKTNMFEYWEIYFLKIVVPVNSNIISVIDNKNTDNKKIKYSSEKGSSFILQSILDLFWRKLIQHHNSFFRLFQCLLDTVNWYWRFGNYLLT